MQQTIVSAERIWDELKSAIGTAIGIDESTIHPGSRLTHDLGAESLDFLDINYRLEQTFGFKMARHFILDHAEEMFGEGSVIDVDMRLTEKAVRLLGIRFDNQAHKLVPGTDMEEAAALITAHSMANVVAEILDTLPEQCPHCSQAAWTSRDGTRIVCGACEQPAVFSNGDDLIIQWLQEVQATHALFDRN